MSFLTIVNVLIAIIGILIVSNTLVLIIISKESLEWRITRGVITVFLGLFLWSVYRFLNRLPSVNIYDYLILLFNFGLAVIGYLTSRHIK